MRLKDFFGKIDESRICKLRLIIRKIELLEKAKRRIGNPAEVSQYFQNKLVFPDATLPKEPENVKPAERSQRQSDVPDVPIKI